jgi:ribosomal protein S4
MKILPAQLLARTGITVSQAEARRYILGGVVRVNGNLISDLSEIEVEAGDEITVGKRVNQVLTEELCREVF